MEEVLEAQEADAAQGSEIVFPDGTILNSMDADIFNPCPICQSHEPLLIWITVIEDDESASIQVHSWIDSLHDSSCDTDGRKEFVDAVARAVFEDINPDGDPPEAA